MINEKNIYLYLNQFNFNLSFFVFLQILKFYLQKIFDEFITMIIILSSFTRVWIYLFVY